jgi:hypothetical protein
MASQVCDSISPDTFQAVVEKSAIQAHVYSIYRELMGTEEPQLLTLVEGLWAKDQCVLPKENIKMAITFTEQDLDEVLA